MPKTGVVKMDLQLCSLCFLLLLIAICAEFINPTAKITKIYSSALSSANRDPVVCHPPDSVHAHIHTPDCFVLENDILLDPLTRTPRLWEFIGMSYPRSYRKCSIIFLLAAPRPHVDPLETFPEYQIAIAAAVVVDKCLRRESGGVKYITPTHQFAIDVKHSRPPDEGHIFPSTNITEKEMIIDSTLLSPVSNTSANTITKSPFISNLTTTFHCYAPREQVQPINRQDCYELFHYMLLRPELLTAQVWSGRVPKTSQSPWHLGSCGFGVIGRSDSDTSYFRLIDPVVAAAMVVQTCSVDRGLDYGGVFSVPDQQYFYVRVANWRRVLAENTTSVESA